MRAHTTTMGGGNEPAEGEGTRCSGERGRRNPGGETRATTEGDGRRWRGQGRRQSRRRWTHERDGGRWRGLGRRPRGSRLSHERRCGPGRELCEPSCDFEDGGGFHGTCGGGVG